MGDHTKYVMKNGPCCRDYPASMMIGDKCPACKKIEALTAKLENETKKHQALQEVVREFVESVEEEGDIVRYEPWDNGPDEISCIVCIEKIEGGIDLDYKNFKHDDNCKWEALKQAQKESERHE